jgi:hypothetical protein
VQHQVDLAGDVDEIGDVAAQAPEPRVLVQMRDVGR